MADNEFSNTVNQIISVNGIKKIPLKDIQITSLIGQGGQAKVFKGLYNNQQVAIKYMKILDYKCFPHELVIITYLDHPNIPKFHGIIHENGEFCLVFDFIEGRTLDKFKPSQFTESIKIQMIYDLASILEYIHQNKIIHRDLKPENLMVSNNGKVYLIDFGISKVCTQSDFTKTRAKGTVNYMAPECLDPDEITEDGQIISVITPKIDVWSFGCVVSWLFSGYVPWTDKYKDCVPIIQTVLAKKLEFTIPKNITNEHIYNVIKMSTIIDKAKRSGMDEIKKYIEDNLVGLIKKE